MLAAELRATVALLDSRDVAGEEDERSVVPAAGFPWTLALGVIVLLALGLLAWWFVAQ